MACEVIQIVRCDRCGNRMEGPAKVDVGTAEGVPVVEATAEASKIAIVVDGMVVARWLDLCPRCLEYVAKQIERIILQPKRRGPKSKAKAAEPKRRIRRKKNADAPLPGRVDIFPDVGAKASERDVDVASVVE